VPEYKRNEYNRNPNIKCKICDKSIYRRPFEIKKNKGRVFCSNNCYGIACRKEHPCVICGKPILAGLHKNTCSRVCANKHRTGIKYKLNRPKDKAHYNKGLKLRLLKQRGRKCERCSYNKYQVLQIHHKDRSRENNELENLELICPNCHAEEHLLKNSWLN
jgi:hypothetical protein